LSEFASIGNLEQFIWSKSFSVIGKGDPPFTDHHLTSLEKLALADPVEQPTWPYLRNFLVPSNSFNTVESFLVQSTTTTTLLAFSLITVLNNPYHQTIG